MPWEFPKRTLTFTSTYDVCSPSDKFMPTDKDNVFTAFKWTEVDKMMFYNRQELLFEYEQDWGLKTTVALKTEENEACGGLYFTPLSVYDPDNPATRHGKMRTTEGRIELRYSPGETFVNTKQRRLKVNFDPPVFTLSHTVGVKGVLGGDYNYNFTEASVYKRFWLNNWGKVGRVAERRRAMEQGAVPVAHHAGRKPVLHRGGRDVQPHQQHGIPKRQICLARRVVGLERKDIQPHPPAQAPEMA